MSMLSREVINELNALSKETMGSSSKWRKMIELGVPELVQEDTVKLTMVDGKEVKETVKTPVLYKDSIHAHTLKRYTVESVREFMLTVKDRQEQVRALIKRIEEQKKAAEATKQAVADQSGSAV
jgi:hypothetical protein